MEWSGQDQRRRSSGHGKLARPSNSYGVPDQEDVRRNFPTRNMRHATQDVRRTRSGAPGLSESLPVGELADWCASVMAQGRSAYSPLQPSTVHLRHTLPPCEEGRIEARYTLFEKEMAEKEMVYESEAAAIANEIEASKGIGAVGAESELNTS